MSDLGIVEVQEAVWVEIVGGVPGADGTPGTPGAPGSAPQAYTHTQGSPSATWVVIHNLGYKPAGVYVEDSSEMQHEPSIHHDSDNQMTLTFIGAMAGFALVS